MCNELAERASRNVKCSGVRAFSVAVCCHVKIVVIVRTVGGQLPIPILLYESKVSQISQRMSAICQLSMQRNLFCNLMEISGKGKIINFQNWSFPYPRASKYL